MIIDIQSWHGWQLDHLVSAVQHSSMTPENLLMFLDKETQYRIDDVIETTRSYGLVVSAWEYMWTAVSNNLMEVFASGMTSTLPQSRLAASFPDLGCGWHYAPVWKWPRQVFSLYDRLDNGWATDWGITSTMILLTANFDPVQIYKLCEACVRICRWLDYGGKPPDMKFPYPRDPLTAYHKLAAPEMLRSLGE